MDALKVLVETVQQKSKKKGKFTKVAARSVQEYK
jgi:hypothetical protein